MIVATLPVWDEGDALIAGAIASTVHAGIRTIRYGGGIAGATGDASVDRAVPFQSEATMRRHGLRLARGLGATWWLQLDADERLQNAAQLAAWIDAWEGDPWALPLPYVHEEGWATYAPFKLVRADRVDLVSHCDYFQLLDERREQGSVRHVRRPIVYRLSGFTVPPALVPLLQQGPWLLHAPSLRRNGHRRLSLDELSLEPRPEHAVDFPLPDPPYLKARSRDTAA